MFPLGTLLLETDVAKQNGMEYCFVGHVFVYRQMRRVLY